jgi:hypothetical protein
MFNKDFWTIVGVFICLAVVVGTIAHAINKDGVVPPTPTQLLNSNIDIIEDAQHGVVCYNKWKALSCVKVDSYDVVAK